MPCVEVVNEKGEVVWRSPEVEEPLVERFENLVKVVEFDTGQVLAAYELKPGESVRQ
jgi:hypothetical protein